jgi:hypothetical protein
MTFSFTKKEVADAIAIQVMSKAEYVNVEGETINAKNISRIGYHESSAELIRTKKSEEFRALPQKEQLRIKRAEYLKACQTNRKHKQELIEGGMRQVKQLNGETKTYQIEEPKKEKKKDNGDEPMYYMVNGEKMYS